MCNVWVQHNWLNHDKTTKVPSHALTTINVTTNHCGGCCRSFITSAANMMKTAPNENLRFPHQQHSLLSILHKWSHSVKGELPGWPRTCQHDTTWQWGGNDGCAKCEAHTHTHTQNKTLSEDQQQDTQAVRELCQRWRRRRKKTVCEEKGES